MGKLKIDLSEVLAKGLDIEAELRHVIVEASSKMIPLVQIMHEKDSAESRRSIMRILSQPDIQKLYYKVEKDGKSMNRIFVHLRTKNQKAFHG